MSDKATKKVQKKTEEAKPAKAEAKAPKAETKAPKAEAKATKTEAKATKTDAKATKTDAKSAKKADTKAAPAAEKKVHKQRNPNVKRHQPIRLYTRAIFTGFRRNLGNQNNNHAILRLEGVRTKKDTLFYLGKRVAYIYRAKKLKEGKRFRVVWGRIQRPHGSSGSVRATFRKNLPSKAMGAQLRVMLYPSRV